MCIRDRPVTIYWVVPGGVAIGFWICGSFNPVAGLQAYCTAPPAPSWLCAFRQSISLVFVAFIIGDGLSVTRAANVLDSLQVGSVIAVSYTHLTLPTSDLV